MCTVRPGVQAYRCTVVESTDVYYSTLGCFMPTHVGKGNGNY